MQKTLSIPTAAAPPKPINEKKLTKNKYYAEANLVNSVRQKFYRNRDEIALFSEVVKKAKLLDICQRSCNSLTLTFKDLHHKNVYVRTKYCFVIRCFKINITHCAGDVIPAQAKTLSICFSVENADSFDAAVITIIFYGPGLLRQTISTLRLLVSKCMANCWEYEIPEGASSLAASICFKTSCGKCIASKGRRSKKR